MVTLKAHILPHHDLQPPGCRGSIDGSNVTSAVCDASGWAAFQLNAPVILGDAANLLI